MSKRGHGQKCTYCRRTLESVASRSTVAATKDHTEPKCRGGNITVWSCRLCNMLKADLSAAQWQRVMSLHPDWWRKINLYAVKKTIRQISLLTGSMRAEMELQKIGG